MYNQGALYIQGTLTIRGVAEALSSKAANELAQPEVTSLLIWTQGAYHGLLRVTQSTRKDNIWVFTLPKVVGNEWLNFVATEATRKNFYVQPMIDGDEFMIWALQNNKLRGLKYAHGIYEEIKRAFDARLKRDNV